ncbi:FAD-dependent monooxygenase [Actinoplanes sp. NPDC089786]|uniref:FAD-dependent monooxygenase n=1 Tax=Actinoplanes sp. NPDC089786 TaxID=3155185 RepID=UPI00341E08CB
MPQTDTDVLIVGAGPTGLTLAVALAAQGINYRIVDGLAEGANTSRAAVVHARTLEVLAPLGVAEPLIDLGNPAARFSVRDRDRVLMTIDFTGLPTPYPYTLMVSQATTEAVLLHRLKELGGEVERPRRVTGLTREGDTAAAVLEDGSRITARWVVGADGMHSKVREAAGIPFTGAAYEESFILADVRISADVRTSTDTPADEVILYFAPAGMLVLAPLPGGVHRVVATVDRAPEHPSVGDVQSLLDARGPSRRRAVVEDLVWGSRFRVHHRIASHYREGPFLLAGDAAHVHSPAGGQGMNTGIQDAVALAEALATPDAIGRYEETRRPVAADVIRTADRLTRLATMPSWRRPMRNAALTLAGLATPMPRVLARRLSGIAYRL